MAEVHGSGAECLCLYWLLTKRGKQAADCWLNGMTAKAGLTCCQAALAEPEISCSCKGARAGRTAGDGPTGLLGWGHRSSGALLVA